MALHVERAFLFASIMLVIVASLSANQSCFFRFEKPIVSTAAVVKANLSEIQFSFTLDGGQVSRRAVAASWKRDIHIGSFSLWQSNRLWSRLEVGCLGGTWMFILKRDNSRR